ncbi:hypothetical protein ACQKP8_27325, partial [Photobacterium alginatilyticum]|uniref:hypothetical protein n=1 Tax=Photobacterium alginatilyticum TaxID=1775171 RepID=UPI004068321F
TYKVLDEKTFRGQPSIRVKQTDATSSSYAYVSVDGNEKSISLLGFTDENFESYYTPGLLNKLNVNSGSSYEQTTTLSYESPLIKGEFVHNRKDTFKGFETITVPAGTYKTCKFESIDSVTTPDGLTEIDNDITWFAVEHGFEVKSISGKSTTELVEATINGTRV